MTEYKSKSPDASVNRTPNGQCAAILEELEAANGAWVPLPQIMQHAAQYNARIFTLRRHGYNVENRSEVRDGIRHSWFRLVPKAPETPVGQSPSALPSLFGDRQPSSSMLAHELGRADGGR